VVAYGSSIWQGIFYHNRKRANECFPAYATKLVYPGIRPKGRMVSDLDVACKRSPIGENNMVPYQAVMGNVGLCHEQVVRSYLGEITAGLCAAMECGEFSKGVSVACAKPAPLTAEF
jgi:hypothetical protein